MPLVVGYVRLLSRNLTAAYLFGNHFHLPGLTGILHSSTAFRWNDIVLTTVGRDRGDGGGVPRSRAMGVVVAYLYLP